MSEIEATITIIRNQIQGLRIKKIQASDKFQKIEKSLEKLLHSMEEVDDRQVNGIDILEHRGDMESKLKDLFHITEEELETKEQKERFSLELERALVINEMTEIEERIASWNKKLVSTDSTLSVFGVDEYDKNSLEAYAKVANLERELRNHIMDTFSNQVPRDKNWWNSAIPEDVRKSAEGKLQDFLNDSKIETDNSMLEKIDFLDFSDYEAIFRQTGNRIKNTFFNGSDEQRLDVASILSRLRELRNKIMHRPPLTEEELSKFRVYYSDIMHYLKEDK
ncbi:MAG: hypothetical protein HOD60_02770 [Candidatus Nitrosopelagicus sp.]|jgi:hypothetical protein|nr:hypothetical protein [Candidatus Nitrosopelagicus sp.]